MVNILNNIYAIKHVLNTRNGRVVGGGIYRYDFAKQQNEISQILVNKNEHIEKMIVQVTEAYNAFESRLNHRAAVVIISASNIIKVSSSDSLSYIHVDLKYIVKTQQFYESFYLSEISDLSLCLYEFLSNIVSDNKYAVEKCRSGYLDGGIIFSNEAAALIVHEFAHLFEADIYLYSRQYLNKINSKVSLKDIFEYPGLPKIILKHDDEFIENKNVALLNNGFVENIIVDKKWGQIFHKNLSGNARQALQKNAPTQSRMRISELTFHIVTKNDEIFSKSDKYLLIDSIDSGTLDHQDATVNLRIKSSHYYDNGYHFHLQPFLMKMNILELINNISYASDVIYSMARPCGKGGFQLPCGIVCPAHILTYGRGYVLH